MSYQEQKDYETIEQDIASLEEQLEQLEQDIAGAATDFVRLNELTAQKSEIEAALEQKWIAGCIWKNLPKNLV